jgi:hypothetical protein
VSIFAADSCDCCAFACASAPICQLATDAIDGDERRVRAASIEEIAEALDTLESCRRHSCSWHGEEWHARSLLQSIVDTEQSEDLTRPDLTLRADQVDVLDVVYEPYRYGAYSEDQVYLVQPHRDGRYCGAPVQAVQTTDDYDPEHGPTYLFVPLAFGPVREGV